MSNHGVAVDKVPWGNPYPNVATRRKELRVLVNGVRRHRFTHDRLILALEQIAPCIQAIQDPLVSRLFDEVFRWAGTSLSALLQSPKGRLLYREQERAHKVVAAKPAFCVVCGCALKKMDFLCYWPGYYAGCESCREQTESALESYYGWCWKPGQSDE